MGKHNKHKKNKNKWGLGKQTSLLFSRPKREERKIMDPATTTDTEPAVPITLPTTAVSPASTMQGLTNAVKPKYDIVARPKDPPTVKMNLSVYNDIAAVIENMEPSMEVSWFCIVKKNTDGDYVIEDILIPEQECHGATTEMTVEGMNKVYREVLEARGMDDYNAIRCWGHLHPWTGDSVGPSGQDEDQFIEFNKKFGYDWFMRVIFNKDLVAKFDLINFKEGWRWDDLPWEIVLPTAEEKRVEELRAQLAAKVKRFGSVVTVGSFHGAATGRDIDDSWYERTYGRGGQTSLFPGHTPLNDDVPPYAAATIPWNRKWDGD